MLVWPPGRGGSWGHDKENFSRGIIFLGYKSNFQKSGRGGGHMPQSPLVPMALNVTSVLTVYKLSLLHLSHLQTFLSAGMSSSSVSFKELLAFIKFVSSANIVMSTSSVQ